ncbi:MAG: hypothetical protein F6K26_33925 [Moorea sp. SIO2I5]|nr:hypothetical protein [Moorena sp. SIO2I5]
MGGTLKTGLDPQDSSTLYSLLPTPYSLLLAPKLPTPYSLLRSSLLPTPCSEAPYNSTYGKILVLSHETKLIFTPTFHQ